MKVAVVGAGLMGRAIVFDLAQQKNISQITVFDLNEEHAFSIAKKFGQNKAVGQFIDLSTISDDVNPFHEFDAIISAVSYIYNEKLLKLAIAAKAHFFDLGGNNDMVATEFSYHQQAKANSVTAIPDCGLAPGMVSVLAAAGIKEFDRVDSVKIRVGGLPQLPHPPLNYQMVFSSEGLINEYWEPVTILQNGKIKTVDPMSAIEALHFEKLPPLEAFYTSGGTSTLPQTFQDKIDFLDYKTIRYQGHCELFRPMLELGLASREKISVKGQQVEPRSVFKAVLEKALNFSEPDITLMRIDFQGSINHEKVKLRYEFVDKADEKNGLTSMMRTTAFPIAIIANMTLLEKIKYIGVVAQESVVDTQYFIEAIKQRGINLTQQFINIDDE